MPPLNNSKWEKFCLSYFENGGKRKAAIAAGYKEKYAHRTACLLLKNTKVANRLAELQEEASSPIVLSIEKRKERLSELAGKDIRDPVTAKESVLAIAELNKMERIYAPEGSGNTYNINVDKVLIDARGKLESVLNRMAARIAKENTDSKPDG